MFSPRHRIVHNARMSEQDRVTSNPPPPEQRDLDSEHRGLIELLANHPDPKIRILAHISTRQFELSERLSSMQKTIDEGFKLLRDKVDALDAGFTDVEDRTEALEERLQLNENSSPTQ